MITIAILEGTHENQSFSIGERMVALSPDMDQADAETINQQYPGIYLTITESTDQPEQAVATVDKAKGGKTADKTETTK